MEPGRPTTREPSLPAHHRWDARGCTHDLLAQLCEPPDWDSDFLVAAVPVPTADPVCLLEALPYEPAVFWASSPDDAICGVGAAARIEATGPNRFSQVRLGLESLWAGVQSSPLAPGAAPSPRALGGFAFQPGSARTGGWAKLGDASFLLPRWTYLRSGETSWLLAVRDRRRGERGLTRLAAELDRVVDALDQDASSSSSPGLPEPPTPGTPLVPPVGPTPHQWSQQVASILRAIHAGAVEKVVTARSVTVDLDADCSPSALLGALRAHDSTSTRFAIRSGDATFLGATPERLVRKQGDRVSTEALAGTRDLGDDEALLASSKDLREHAFVVSAIRTALEPFCDRLEVSDQPQLHTLPHLVHLRSPVRGDLRPDTHVLDLVQALHPTPAVGGVPQEAALSWIEDHEPTARGWYSAPFGWADREGNGDFCVALRCALVEFGRAQLFAGAGIVDGSEANQEFEETEWKLRTLRCAVTRLQASSS